MKRDDDYIRDLLLEAEASDQPYLYAFNLLAPSPEESKRLVHVTLLTDAGLFAKEGEHAFRLTNQGHDYLAAIRDDGVWQKTKDAAAGFGGVTLGIMKDLAVGYLKQEMSQRLGITLS